MSMQDPIADMLTRIRNAQSVGEKKISFPSSTIKKAILSVMKKEGYIQNFDSTVKDAKHNISVELSYFEGKPVIKKIKRISRVSLRTYKGSQDLPVVCSGMGIAIVSTSHGVMTGSEAKSRNLGGEVLCTVE